MVPTLFRYFMAASLMRGDFDRHLKTLKGDEDVTRFMSSKSFIYMCLWYGMLYVVIEGWREADLSDPEVDRLLASPNVDFLRKFRNGMFHFQQDTWLSQKLHDFIKPQHGTVDWVISLTSKFRRFLLTEMKRISPPPSTP